jgi:hypothetical protein
MNFASTFYLSQIIDNERVLKHARHFSIEYEGESFPFTPHNGVVDVHITQKDIPFADIDQITFSACGERIDPEYIRYADDPDKDLREDLSDQDHNVIVAHEKDIEAQWIMPDDCQEEGSLYMYANEYGRAYPFRFEGKHTIGEVTTYEPYWRPSTGHPDGTTFITITEDDNDIMFDLDITMDNTDDVGQDWLEVQIGEKVFRVDDHDDTYGQCPFGTSEKVSYKHQLCEMRIPKNEIDDVSSFDFTLRYYGTGGWSGSGNNIFVRKWDASENAWMSMDGTSEYADIVFSDIGDIGEFEEEYDDAEQYQMIRSSDGRPMIATTYRSAYDNIIYAEWNDSVHEWRGKDGVSYYSEIADSEDTHDLRLARTSNDDPMIVWRRESWLGGDIRFVRWDGGVFSAIDTGGYDAINFSSSVTPQIVVNDSDHPIVGYSYGAEDAYVEVQAWDGNSWESDTITVDMPADRLRMARASDDTVSVAWGISGYSSDNGIHMSRWDGSALRNMGDSDTYDIVETISGGDTIMDLEIMNTSDDRPMVVWSLSDGGGGMEPCTHFKQWSGDLWVAGDGVSTTSDNLSGDVVTGHTDVVMNSRDEPSIVWEEYVGGDTNDIYFSMLPLEVMSPRSVISQKINGSIVGIIRATLTATEVLNGVSYINYFLSGNGGVNWLPVESGQEIVLPDADDLRWRADLYAGSVPELHSIVVNYETMSLDLNMPECGGAAQTYGATESDFDGSLCAVGSPDDAPSFPQTGQSVAWMCTENSQTVQCHASRDAVNAPDDEDEDEDEDDVDQCVTDAVRDVTNDSVTLRVSVDDEYAGDSVTFKIESENIAIQEKETIKIKEKPSDNGKVSLIIDHLAPDTEYRFKVSYKEGDEYLYCPHSKTTKTDTKIVGPQPSEESYPECGSAAQGYGLAQSAFIGSFCAKGKIVTTPVFPEPGGAVTWTCVVDDNTEDCHASREDHPVTPPVIKGGTDPVSVSQPEQEQEPITIQEESLHATAAVGLITGVMLTFAASAVPLFATMPIAAKDVFIMPLLGLLARRRNEQNWGTVFEQTTKQPIPGVKITLNDAMGKEIETTYSDHFGRFGFLTHNGTYVIDVEKMKYAKNFDHNVDPLYGDVYIGEPITIEENKMITINIAMNALNINWEEYAKKKSQVYKGFFSTFKKWLFIIVYYVGFVATIYVTYLYPTLLNGILLVLYILLFVYDHFIKKKKFGTVETGNNDPVPFAIVSLYNKMTGEKNGFAVTDVIGRYYLLSENGNFEMHIKGQPVGGQIFEKKGNVRVHNGLVRKDVKI